MILHTDNMILWSHFGKAAVIVAETSSVASKGCAQCKKPFPVF